MGGSMLRILLALCGPAWVVSETLPDILKAPAQKFNSAQGLFPITLPDVKEMLHTQTDHSDADPAAQS